MILILSLITIAGMLNGIMDSIKAHDSYAHWGWFWSAESWKDLYRDPSFLERLFNASFNAWHILKWAMFCILFGCIVIAGLTLQPMDWWKCVAFGLAMPTLFGLGFRVTYK